MKHLAIFIGDAIENILNGKKTIESRFSMNNTLPYGSVSKGDEVLLKKSGGDILGRVIADNVLFYQNFGTKGLVEFRKMYSEDLCVDEKFWEDKSKARYVSLIFLKEPQRFVAAIKFKKHDRRPWVVLPE
jgi:ASC-1-like (ASCH) protein